MPPFSRKGTGNGSDRAAFGRETARQKSRAPAVLESPLPALGRAADTGWRAVALDTILSRRVRPFVGPVEVSLTFRDGRARRVIGELPNACLEVLDRVAADRGGGFGGAAAASARLAGRRRADRDPPVRGVQAMSGPKPVQGHDGEPPEFRRRGTTVQNIHVDRLEWLLAHGHIDVAQHGAGRRLQRDRELAAIGGHALPPAFAARTRGGGFGARSFPTDVKCDAIRRMNAARAHVGGLGFRILELVVLGPAAVHEAARRLGEPVAKLPLALKVALDSLAGFHRLA